MKPVALKMQAFGPFAGTEIINFGDLGESPLFLINGPTGSGKTTILDAICYALYGTTTGDEREAKEMRSQQSDADLLTEVELDFELAGVKYRVIRSPDQFRPKLRGEGLTPHKSRADLYRLGPDGDIEGGELLVEQKVRDVSDRIKQLTGMEVEQFRQVMVLPQGQFRKLLMADSKERESIFQTLFQTAIYKRIEDKLRDQSNEVRTAYRDANALIQNILAGAHVTSEEELDERIGAVSADLDLTDKVRSTTQEAWQQADTALRAGKDLVEKFTSLDQARKDRDALFGQQPEMDKVRLQLDMARKASKLLPVLAKVTQLSASKKEADEQLRLAEKTANEKRDAKEQAQSELDLENERSGEREALSESIRQLKSFKGKSDELNEAKRQLDVALAEQSSATAELNKAQKARDEHLAKETPLTAEISTLEAEIECAAGTDVEVQRLETLLGNKRELKSLESTKPGLSEQLRNAEAAHAQVESDIQEADNNYKRLQKEWHRSQAAALALELKDGEPCQVCGSTSHPNPASSAQISVTQDMLDASSKSLEEVRKQLVPATAVLTRCQGNLKSFKERKSELLKELGDEADRTLDEVEKQLEATRAASQKLVTNQRRLKSAREELTGHGGVFKEKERAVRDAESVLGSARANVAGLTGRHEAAEKALPAEYREPGHLEMALTTSENQLEELNGKLKRAREQFRSAENESVAADTAVKNTTGNLKTVSDNLTQAEQDWTEALNQSAFNTEQEVTLASMDDQEFERLELEVKEFDEGVLRCASRIETLESQLKGKEPPNVEQLDSAEVAARKSRDEAHETWNEVSQQLGILKKTRKSLNAKINEMADLDAQYRVVGTLADVACGNKGAKVSLQRYVLGVLLDDVLIHASQRLMKMSDGRYELTRKRDPSKRNKASGLDLEVYDDYTGESRSVATLSGGESFMAALSLALGLSDVVQAQTGGIRLDTLFVDEGFGTLDSGALEMAMSTLMDLQQAGRMVGVISHVSELREQMDVRLDISKGKAGSSVKLVSPLAR